MEQRWRCASNLVMVVCVALATSGCTVAFKKATAQSPPPAQQPVDVSQLTSEVERLNKELELLNRLKAMEARELGKTKDLLEQRLRNEIKQEGVSVQVEERGLVITVLDQVLFDSGKSEIREDAHGVLDKVAAVLREEVTGRQIAVEGHTDNEPIKHSGWPSNWELSASRATSVLRYLESQEVGSERLQATGYGEFHPVTSNETDQGREQNRRVEIVVLPKATGTQAGSMTMPGSRK